jgi:pimeloyl-ACP methyl ester carboxylesterase
MARVIPRETRARNAYRFEAACFKDFRTPTLLLTGGRSAPELRAAVDMLHAALPESRVIVLEGESHVAMSSAPDLFLREVMKFLRE